MLQWSSTKTKKSIRSTQDDADTRCDDTYYRAAVDGSDDSGGRLADDDVN